MSLQGIDLVFFPASSSPMLLRLDATSPSATPSKGEEPHPPSRSHTGIPVPSQAACAQTVDSLAAAQALWQP